MDKQDLILDMQVIQIGEKTYLGMVKELENGAEITNALQVSEVSNKTFSNWLKINNLGNLENITLKGFISYNYRKLNDMEEMLFSACIDKMHYAKKTAIAHVENNVYDKVFE